MKELIPHMNPTEIKVVDFKDKRLAKATQRIMAIYNEATKYAEDKNRSIAEILGTVALEKSYEKDGFKSVADYAHAVFGIARQSAYALANAGKVYNDVAAHPELKAMTPSKIAELATVEGKDLKEALDSGKISRNSTQKELRDFASKEKDNKDSEKPTVLDSFIARPCITMVTEEQTDTFSSAKTMDEWDDWFMGYVSTVSPDSPVEIVKLSKGKVDPNATKATVNRRLYFNRFFSIVVEFFKYTPAKPTNSASKSRKFTREQLIAMLAEMD